MRPPARNAPWWRQPINRRFQADDGDGRVPADGNGRGTFETMSEDVLQPPASEILAGRDRAPVITRGVSRALIDLGYSVLTEVRLVTGRRVDVMGISRKNRIAIVEVKSGPADFLSDRKWQEYLEFCDLFYFAVAPDFPRELLPPEPGLIVADRYGGVVLREAPEMAMAPSRRRAVTLRFALHAADRLQRLEDSEAL